MSLRTLAGFELEGEGCSRKGKGGGGGGMGQTGQRDGG